MKPLAFAVLIGGAALSAPSLQPAFAAPPTASASAFPPTAASSPAARFAEGSRLLRAGRHAAAYGRFVALANEGDREAAGIALVMHRHGPLLFGSAWDATTEELEYWSELARSADRAEIDARRRLGPRPVSIGSGPGEAAYLAPETFRGDRRRKR
jgi:hypothetical protein